MLRPVCDICTATMRANIVLQEHYCDRCAPYAEEYRNGRMQIMSEGLAMVEKKIDQYRNKFFREVVQGRGEKRLEAVK